MIESVSPGVGFNFDTLFEKVDPYTVVALEQRIDDPTIFTTVEVRNDQDINLFAGATADNSLNAVSEVLESQLETNGIQIVNISDGD